MAEEIITETNRETATDHAYGGAQIQVLEGLEAVRKRPGMYIGSTGPSGLHHLVYEIVDNAIDEALAGYCTHIEVTIKPGNIIEVSDNGRGIPVDIQPKLGIPAVTVVYTVLHAGGKFGGEDSGYKVAGGLHGVGASVVNALSEWLEVNVHKNGKIYQMKFSRGETTQAMTVVGETDHTGTTVRFKPDPVMFEDTVYDYETGSELPVYDLQQLAGEDAYAVFLSGSKALLTITNPAAKTDRELVVFRDSFASSLTPLLAGAYAKITLVDIRYLQPERLGTWLTFDTQDVLFLYSAPVLNSSETIR